MKNLFFSCLLIILISLKCADAHCLNVSPGRIEISVDASKGYSDVLIIKNTDKRDLRIKLRLEDWFKAIKGTNLEFNWLKISPLEFNLNQGEVKEVELKVVIPKNARGELNAMIFVEAKPKEITEGSIGINTSIGVPIYVMIKGTEQFKAEVEDLQVAVRSPLQLAVKIKNSGNVHIRPEGTIEIINTPARQSFDQKAGGDAHRLNTDSHRFTVPLNKYNYPVLPNSSRTLEIRSEKGLEAGEYIADIKMGYADRKYRKKITVILK